MNHNKLLQLNADLLELVVFLLKDKPISIVTSVLRQITKSQITSIKIYLNQITSKK